MKIDEQATKAYQESSMYHIPYFIEEIYNSDNKLIGNIKLKGIPEGRSCGGSVGRHFKAKKDTVYHRYGKRTKVKAGADLVSVILPVCGRMKVKVHTY